MTQDSNVSNDTIIDCMKEYSRQKRRCAEEQGVLRNIAKRAKAQGINVHAMTATERATKLEPEDVARDMSDQLRYMALRRIEITPAVLFDTWNTDITQKTAAEDQTWEAEDAGYQAGRHGADYDDSPYPPGTELDVRWREHWNKGQAAIAREMGPDAKVASTSRQRPAKVSEDATVEPVAAISKVPKPARRKAAGTNGMRPRRSKADAESAVA